MLHVFLGTKAQYIKTAPVVRELDRRGVSYRLIDSGQHARLTRTLRSELGLREPDVTLGGADDVDTIPGAIAWSARTAARMASRTQVRREIFGGENGTCVVHGDTPSTLLSTVMARRAGLRVAHLEAGLRSHSLVHPFPEELIRLLVMRRADVLFAPDEHAVRNLAALHVRGRVVRVAANTSVEALRAALSGELEPCGAGPAVVTVHRVENLHRPRRLEQLVDVVVRIATKGKVEFVVHGPTSAVFAKRGLDAKLRHAGVEVVPLLPHAAFARRLRDAPFVITDGGSVQEECALLGVPTLLWRARTERDDGLGANVVLSRYDASVVERFLAHAEEWRRPVVSSDVQPSQEIVDALLSG
ncbi:MAG TPA: UDP-N-acetylglucosamine 2-epimerase [Acidimicrobiales bacterium]|nr:UDP-N-acetylglucosamine 2-epimerase [Acidimicrobiales bacterium]